MQYIGHTLQSLQECIINRNILNNYDFKIIEIRLYRRGSCDLCNCRFSADCSADAEASFERVDDA